MLLLQSRPSSRHGTLVRPTNQTALDGTCVRLACRLHPRTLPLRQCVSRAARHDIAAVAIDVEYAHLLMSDGTQTSMAAWVCIVAPYADVPLLKTYCRHPVLDVQPSTANTPRPVKSVGGVRLAQLQAAPALQAVAAQILSLWDGHTLVGHGLAKDLRALDLHEHMQTRSCYDTITFSKFQGSGGTARSLKRLAKDLLGMNVHKPGQPHDPEVDARAVLQLYMEHARPMLLGSYDDLVAHYTLRYLEEARQKQGMALQASEAHDSAMLDVVLPLDALQL